MMASRVVRNGVTRTQIARVMGVLKEFGVTPTGAEIAPDGTVRLLTDERGKPKDLEVAAFDTWWAQNGETQ